MLSSPPWSQTICAAVGRHGPQLSNSSPPPDEDIVARRQTNPAISGIFAGAELKWFDSPNRVDLRNTMSPLFSCFAPSSRLNWSRLQKGAVRPSKGHGGFTHIRLAVVPNQVFRPLSPNSALGTTSFCATFLCCL